MYSKRFQYFSSEVVNKSSTGLLLSLWYAGTLGYVRVLYHRLVVLSACGEHTSATEGEGVWFRISRLADTCGEAVIGSSMWWPHFLCTHRPLHACQSTTLSTAIHSWHSRNTSEFFLSLLCLLCREITHFAEPVFWCCACGNGKKQASRLMHVRRWINSNSRNKLNALEQCLDLAFDTQRALGWNRQVATKDQPWNYEKYNFFFFFRFHIVLVGNQLDAHFLL
jgi:hypothetical protein